MGRGSITYEDGERKYTGDDSSGGGSGGGGSFQGSGVPYPNVSRGDDEYASKMRANLARSQWEDYKTRFQPYEDELTRMAQEGPGEMVSTATDQATTQFGTGREIAGRQRTRYGLGSTPDPSQQRQEDLAQGLAVVDARNKARSGYNRQRLGLLTGGQRTPAAVTEMPQTGGRNG